MTASPVAGQGVEWLPDLVARLERDLQAWQANLRLEVTVLAGGGPEPEHRVLVVRDGGEPVVSFAFGRPPTSLAALVATLVSRLQDALVDAARFSGGDVVWPHCRAGHPHPMEAQAVHHDVVWTCPADGTAVTRLGEL